jgi:hypothetical protein
VEGRKRTTGGGCYGGLEYEELGSRVQEEGEEGGLAQEWRDRAEQELQEKAEWRTRDIQALRSEDMSTGKPATHITGHFKKASGKK